MAVIGKYIYGIIPGQSLSPALGQAQNFSEGCGANGVHTIAHRDISAVVSEAEIFDFTHMLRDALARQLVKHQKVIEGIMPGHTIIPMRLGTFASDKNEVRDILNKGYRVIKDVFEKIGDKIEIDVVATWSDFDSVLKEVGEEKEIREFKEKLLANPKGITVDNQLKVGVVVKKALDEKRERYATIIQNALRGVSQDLRVHKLMDDKMVTNTASLISKVKQEDFDKGIEELNSRFAEKLNFRCVGPLPPYSFYALEIKRLQFGEIDWARRKLGLRESAGKDELGKARKRSAISTHPDTNPATPGVEREFDGVTKAYHILLDYCLAAEQAGQGERCSFRQEEFEKCAILLKVRE